MGISSQKAIPKNAVSALLALVFICLGPASCQSAPTPTPEAIYHDAWGQGETYVYDRFKLDQNDAEIDTNSRDSIVHTFSDLKLYQATDLLSLRFTKEKLNGVSYSAVFPIETDPNQEQAYAFMMSRISMAKDLHGDSVYDSSNKSFEQEYPDYDSFYLAFNALRGHDLGFTGGDVFSPAEGILLYIDIIVLESGSRITCSYSPPPEPRSLSESSV